MVRNTIDWVAIILLIIGGLNWGLVGIFNFDLVKFLFSSISILINIIYILVGIAAVYGIIRIKNI
ncbi:MAG: DUF378 domain-containing protein [archaeon]